jgi:transposase
LLAHVLVSKYADHLPLYRLSQIFAREGVDIDRSTMADWVGRSTTLLEPLADAIGRIVRRGPALQALLTAIAMNLKKSAIATFLIHRTPAGRCARWTPLPAT